MLRLCSLLVVIFLLTIPSNAFSQTDSSTITPGNFTFIQKGNKAPFSGTLFDERATAYILIDKESREKDFTLRLQKELDKIKLDYDLKLSLKSNELDSEKKKNKELLEKKDEQIQTMTSKISGSTNLIDDILKIGGGSLGGAIIVVLLVLVL
jgi:hypothetical protein